MALDTKQGYVYFGLGSGELLRILRNDTQDLATYLNPCLCNIYISLSSVTFETFGPLGGELISLAVDAISNYMFIGLTMEFSK